jgi:hypothetical protein
LGTPCGFSENLVEWQTGVSLETLEKLVSRKAQISQKRKRTYGKRCDPSNIASGFTFCLRTHWLYIKTKEDKAKIAIFHAMTTPARLVILLMAHSPSHLLMGQSKTLPATVPDLTGRIGFITSADVGLGNKAARRFLAKSPRKVAMTIRDLTKGQAVVNATNKTTKDVLEVWEPNLASFERTVQFARKANGRLDRFDILILNAGISTNIWAVTEYGYETS